MTSKFEELGVSSWTCLMLSRAIALLKWFSLNTLAQKIQLLLPRQKQKDPVGLSEQNLQITSLPWLTSALFFIGETCCKVVTFVTWHIREVRIGKNKTLVTLSIWAMKNRMGYFRSLTCTSSALPNGYISPALLPRPRQLLVPIRPLVHLAPGRACWGGRLGLGSEGRTFHWTLVEGVIEFHVQFPVQQRRGLVLGPRTMTVEKRSWSWWLFLRTAFCRLKGVSLSRRRPTYLHRCSSWIFNKLGFLSFSDFSSLSIMIFHFDPSFFLYSLFDIVTTFLYDNSLLRENSNER